MGEVLIKPRSTAPEPALQDGDIIAAVSDRRMRARAAAERCHPKHGAFTSDGLRADGLVRPYLERVKQYRFERLDRTTVRRVDLRAGTADVLSALPNDRGERINVALYVQRRRLHPRHAIFGTPGREVWYGGHTFLTDADLDAVWAMLEAALGVPEPVHRWSWGIEEQRYKLPVEIGPLDDADAQHYVAPLKGMVEGPGGDLELQTVRARNIFIPWRDWQTELGVSEADVHDRTKPIIVRGRGLLHTAMVVDKPSLPVIAKPSVT